MFSLGYAWNELRRRWGRTLVTAFGLAAGVGLVMGIIGVSQGLSDAQNSVLSPLGSVGTDIIVTRTVAPTTSQTTTTTTIPSRGFGGGSFPAGGGGGFTGGGGGGFFARGVPGASSADSSQAATLLNNNSSVITDLAKLGPAGTQFTHDFFVPGTLITFPSVAIGDVAKIPEVTSAVGALSLEALHESGTVPKISDTVQDRRPDDLDHREASQAHRCSDRRRAGLHHQAVAEDLRQRDRNDHRWRPSPLVEAQAPAADGTTSGASASNPAFEKCLTPAQISLRAEGHRTGADHHPGAQPADDQHRHVQLQRGRRGPDE